MYANQLFITGYEQGMNKNTEHSMIAHSIEDAEDSFVDAKERLLDVNNWNKYCDIAGVDLKLTDGHRRPVKRRAHKGDHIRIGIKGMRECCVVIDALEYDDYPDLSLETFTMRLHPCVHSMTSNEEDNDLSGVAGSLIIERRHKHLYAAFESRNATQGMGELANVLYSWFGLTDAHWNMLLSRFID